MINFLPQTQQQPTQDAEIAELLNKQQAKEPAKEKLTEFLLSFIRKIDDENQRAKKIRLQTMISMCRRHRGASASDLYGIFHPTYDVWLEDESFNYLHGTNIFQSLVRGAEANYTQAKVKLDIRATGNDFTNRSCEKIGKGIYEILSQTHWTETTEQLAFYAMMLKLNAFIISRFNPHKGSAKLKLPQFEEQAIETGGTYICSQCESYGEFTSESGYQCQQCGNEDGLTLIEEPQVQSEQLVSGYNQDTNAGETETIIADGFDCDFDDSTAECSNFGQAQWFEYHYLCDKEELRRLYPHLKSLDKEPKWTLQTRWKMALKRHSTTAINPTSENDKRLHEIREFYLEPNLYAGRGVEPEDIKLGEQVVIKKGENASQKYPNGVLAIAVNDEIAGIYDNNYKRTAKTSVWLADPTSGWGLGAKAGLPIQKKINHLDNINMEGIDRALRGAIIYDSEAISGTSLEGSNTNIPLRSDFSRAGAPITDFFAPVNTQGLSQDVMLFLQTQHDTIQKIMGVPDAAIGETNANNVTATGQQLEASKATGLLVPAKKSQAHAMEGWCLDQLCLIQKHYTPERIKTEFGSRFGEDWLDDEIQAFLESDLEKAITVEYVEGSEIPQTRAEKEQKLAMMISAGFVPPTPENISKLVSQSGIDGLDVGGYDTNIKIAQKRWTFIRETYKQNAEGLDLAFQQMETMMVDPATGQRLTDPMGNVIPNPILLQFLDAPTLQVVDEAEEHPIHETYWKKKTNELSGASQEQSRLLIELCRTMILRHQNGAFAQTAKAQTLMGMAQMPMQQVQQGMQTQQADEQMQKQQMAEEGNQQAQRQAQVEDKLIDHRLSRDTADDSHKKAMEMEKAKAKSKK